MTEGKPLAGKVAVVTGAGRMRSIGREVALELARQGCDVVLNGSGSDPSTWPASEQAAGWKVFKSPDMAGMNHLYVFVIYPAVKGADYQISNIIAEAFPTEANAILAKYADAYAQGMNIVNLNLLQDMGK